MAWKLDGTYFENCSCEMPCPCTFSLDAGADYDRCEALLAFHIDSGEVDGTDVSDLTVALVTDAPRVMTDGNWKLGLIIDEAASDEQAEKLGAVFGGDLGGPMAALAPLIGDMRGVERARVDYASGNGSHRIAVGEGVEIEVEDVVPFGSEDGKPAQGVNLNHPAGSTLTLGKASKSRVDVLGFSFSAVGKSGFSAPFSWAG